MTKNSMHSKRSLKYHKNFAMGLTFHESQNPFTSSLRSDLFWGLITVLSINTVAPMLTLLGQRSSVMKPYKEHQST